jgi:spermidine synthase
MNDVKQMKRADRLLSYLYPVTIEVTNSTWNPVLEVVLNGGKYSLNSENTNYSFGSLHTLFRKTFRKLKLNWKGINDVLILGFGTGSVARIIGKYKSDCIIDGVEIDNKIIELGEKYFHTDSLKNTNIYCAAADQFLEDYQKKYDLIVIDVYLDMNVPEELETEKFLVLVRNALKVGGLVVFNKFINSKTTRDQMPLLKELYENTFHNLKITTVMVTGRIFVAKKLTE